MHHIVNKEFALILSQYVDMPRCGKQTEAEFKPDFKAVIQTENLINQQAYLININVTKSDEVKKRKDNPRLCNSCQKEADIVFTKDNIRLCKKCLDIFKDKYGQFGHNQYMAW